MSETIDYQELSNYFDKISKQFDKTKFYNTNQDTKLRSGEIYVFSKISNGETNIHLTESVNPETGQISEEKLYVERDGEFLQAALMRTTGKAIKPLPLETASDCDVFVNSIREFSKKLN